MHKDLIAVRNSTQCEAVCTCTLCFDEQSMSYKPRVQLATMLNDTMLLIDILCYTFGIIIIEPFSVG